MKLHHMPLFGARPLSSQSFELIAEALKRLLFVRSAAGIKHSGQNEVMFAKWTHEITGLSDEKVPAWIAGGIDKEIARHRDSFIDGFTKLTSAKNPGRLKYAVRKLYEHVETETGTTHLNFWDDKLDVDHIKPCKTPEERKDRDSILNRIGNMALMKRGDNRSAQAGDFNLKQRFLGKSGYLLSQHLVDDKPLGVNSGSAKAMRSLSDLGFKYCVTWGDDEIAARTAAVAQLAWKVWAPRAA